MRKAMATAEVGDDVLDGDPSVQRLEARVAEMLGKEGGLFMPSGTMANQCAIWVWSERGTEVLVDAESHIVHYELAGTAAFSGAQLRLVQGSGLVMDAAALRAALRVPSPHVPRASLVCVENTHNGAGGQVTSLAAMRALSEVADSASLPVHLDGARLWNASVASGASLSDLASCADSVMVSFSKGLGAPVGACLCGSREMVEEAREARRRFGGGMRQSGILAAGALHGLEHRLPHLAEDHRRAADLASRIDGAGGASVIPPQTNIVMVDMPPGVAADDVVAIAESEQLLISAWRPTRLRIVLHFEINDAMTHRAAATLSRALERVARG
jgi:threonine aldolase